LLHNHPSGDPTPSQEDVRLTRQLAESARLLELRVHDHVVIGRGTYVSMAERGII
jgi:DNA repair protein RadC